MTEIRAAHNSAQAQPEKGMRLCAKRCASAFSGNLSKIILDKKLTEKKIYRKYLFPK
jgi:hypothetical protein